MKRMILGLFSVILATCVMAAAVYASELKMYQAFKRQGLADDVCEVIIAQGNHESGCGSQGLCRDLGKNWWAVTCPTGGKVKSERERTGKLVSKRFYYWATYDEAARGLVKYLSENYPDGWKCLNRGDIKGYVRDLKKRGYFTDSEEDYLTGIMRHIER